jgi:hypothetical protein
MITLQLPQDSILRGELHESIDRSWLTQDVLEIDLRNGLMIDVGWYPEHDLSGRFWVRVFKDDWDNQKIQPMRLTDPWEVKSAVEELAKSFSGGISETFGPPDRFSCVANTTIQEKLAV